MPIGEQRKLSDSGLSWILLLFNKISDHGRKDWLRGCHFRLCFAVWSSVCGAAAFDALSQVLRGLHRRDLCYKHCAKQLKNISSSFTKIKINTLYLVLMHCSDVSIIFFSTLCPNHACLRACCVCLCAVQCQKRKSLWYLAFSLWHCMPCQFELLFFFSVCDGFGKQIRLLLWSIIWAFSSFFVTLPVVPLFYFFFLLNPYPCVVLSILDVFPWIPRVCSYLPSFLPSLLSSMQRLSFWQTCAITRTLWIIARLSIKGVISPQWPMPWREWAPHPRSQPYPVEPAPSATSMIASLARPVRKPLKGSR